MPLNIQHLNLMMTSLLFILYYYFEKREKTKKKEKMDIFSLPFHFILVGVALSSNRIESIRCKEEKFNSRDGHFIAKIDGHFYRQTDDDFASPHKQPSSKNSLQNKRHLQIYFCFFFFFFCAFFTFRVYFRFVGNEN